MNGSLAGKVYPEIAFEVTEDRVRAFARAVGEEGDFVPPTFATAPEMVGLAQVIADAELGLDFPRVVHGEQTYEWIRPLVVGDVLRCAPRLAAIRSRGGHALLTIESELRDAMGEVVVRARSTLIERGAS